MAASSATLLLWRRAPVWRGALIFAVVSGAVFIAFPPADDQPRATSVAGLNLGPVAEFTPTLRARPAHVAATDQKTVSDAAPKPRPPIDRPTESAANLPTPPARPNLAAVPHVKPKVAALPPAAVPPRPVPVPAAPPQAGPGGLTRPDPSLLKQSIVPPLPVNPNIGTIYRGTYDADGRIVPLPAGEFESVAYISGQIGQTTNMGAALLQVRGNRLAAVVFVFATPAGSKIGTGFRLIVDCTRNDLHYKEVDSNVDFGPQDCVTVNHIWPDGWRLPITANIFKSVLVALDTRGIPLPPALIAVNIYEADRDGYLRVWYYFNPEDQGIESHRTATWADSDWHVNYLARDQRRLAYMEQARQWAHGWRPLLRAAFIGNRMTPPPGLAEMLVGQAQTGGTSSRYNLTATPSHRP